MEKITLELNLNEVNIVLGALSEAPFKTVVGLIEKIKQQAQSQLVQPNSNETE
jgi:hypothetical protein